jgi:hypothetical protein
VSSYSFNSNKKRKVVVAPNDIAQLLDSAEVLPICHVQACAIRGDCTSNCTELGRSADTINRWRNSGTATRQQRHHTGCNDYFSNHYIPAIVIG